MSENPGSSTAFYVILPRPHTRRILIAQLAVFLMGLITGSLVTLVYVRYFH